MNSHSLMDISLMNIYSIHDQLLKERVVCLQWDEGTLLNGVSMVKNVKTWFLVIIYGSILLVMACLLFVMFMVLWYGFVIIKQLRKKVSKQVFIFWITAFFMNLFRVTNLVLMILSQDCDGMMTHVDIA